MAGGLAGNRVRAIALNGTLGGVWLPRRWYRLLWGLPLVFAAVFFVYPLGSIFAVSLYADGQWDFSGFAEIVTSDYYRATLGFTLMQALLSTLLTIGLALPAVYVFTHYQFRGKTLLLALSALPFVLPTVVVAAALAALLGERGIVNSALMSLFALNEAPLQLERSLPFILIAHVFYNYAVALRLMTAYRAYLSARIAEAAQMLGCHGWRLYWEIELPLLRPALLASAVLVFIFTFTSFGVVLILGGLRFATLEVQIYYQALNVFNLPLAAALSLVQMALMLAMLVVYTHLQRTLRVDWQAVAQVARPPRTLLEQIGVYGNVAFMVVLLFAPLGALMVRALTVGGAGFTLEYFALLAHNARDSILFVPPQVAIWNSLFFAVCTTILALFFGILLAYLLAANTRIARILDPLFMLPLATSAVTLGFGYIIALDEPPLNLRASWVLVPLAHTLVATPFVVRSVLPILRTLPPSWREAGVVLGATPWQVWRWIELPLLSRGLIVGATFAFTVSMGEFGASLFVARPDTPTIPIVIFRLLGQPGVAQYGQALALSVLLMGVCALSFLVIERLRTVGVGEF
jgi:thiamine transport system permease protein